MFELGVLCEVFGYDRTADGLPGYEFARVQPRRPAGRHPRRLHHQPRAHDLEPRSTTPTWSPSPPYDNGVEPPAEALDALRRAAERGA